MSGPLNPVLAETLCPWVKAPGPRHYYDVYQLAGSPEVQTMLRSGANIYVVNRLLGRLSR
jgi:hypothetical protein